MIDYIAPGKETVDIKQNDILSCYYLQTPIQVLFDFSLVLAPSFGGRAC